MNYKLTKILIQLLVSVGILMFTSCSDTDEYVSLPHRQTESLNIRKLTPEQALARASVQLAGIEKKYPSKKLLSSSKHSSKKYRLKNVTSIATEPAKESINELQDTLVYIINLQGGGYVITPTYSCFTPILAYIEEGSFSLSDTANINVLSFIYNASEMMDKALPKEKDPDAPRDIEDPGNIDRLTIHKPEYDDWYVKYKREPLEDIAPKLNTNWGQGKFFSRYTPSQQPTGCVPTATAQIMAYFQLPKELKYSESENTIVFNWERIISNKQHYTLEDMSAIAHLMRYIGIQEDVDYGKSSSGTKTSKAVDFLNNHGLSASKLREMSIYEIYNGLRNGGLILARGNAHAIKIAGICIAFLDGHCWVIDGYKEINGAQYVHCNWGWYGDGNGFFLFNIYNPYLKETILDDPADHNRSDFPKYKYNFEYSCVTKI